MSFLTKFPRDRYSDDAFAGFVGQSDFNHGDGKALAWMSQLAYETDAPEKIKEILHAWGMSSLGAGILAADVRIGLPVARTRAVMATGRGATIVAFAGTDPLVLANWITAFDIRTGSAQVAKGFDVAAQSVWPQLQSLLAQPEAAAGPRFVTGHSLGGVLAVLTADRLVKSGGEVDAVYTFGMPRPGSKKFASAYNARMGQRTYRLVYGDDLVPAVPPSAWGFHHVGRYLHCGSGGKFDKEALAADLASNSPPFFAGISNGLKSFLSAPLPVLIEAGRRLKPTASLALGHGPDGTRREWREIAIGLLPPRLRDHVPDRYIAGF